MSQELLYTSSQKGLDPTKRGFCTVLATAGMPSNLSGQLERLSGYKHHFPAGSDEAHQNPVAFSHVTLRINGRETSVLSRVSDYKLDYSGRSNKLAHHVVLDHSERCDAGPAWLLQQHDLMRTEWDGECKNVTHGPIIPMGDQRPALCRTWENVTGDAGHAGQIADAVQQSHKPIWIVYSLSQAKQLLDLLNEVIALVPYDERWNTTFSTFFGQDSPDVNCKIRCVVENSDLARMAPSKGIVFSLTHPKSITNPTLAILAARGVASPAESFEPNILPSSTESIDQIDSSPQVDSSPAPTVNKEQSPPPLPSTAHKRERATSREKVSTASVVSPRPGSPPPPRESQQKIQSPTNWKPIVLTSVVTAAVVTLIFSAGITAYVWLGPNPQPPLVQNNDSESTETGVEPDLSKEQPLQSSTNSAAPSSGKDSVESTNNAAEQAHPETDEPAKAETTSDKEDSAADAASDAEDKKKTDKENSALSEANADAKKPPAKDAKNKNPENADVVPVVMAERQNVEQQKTKASDSSLVNKDTTAKKTTQNQSPPQQDTTTVSGSLRIAKISLNLIEFEQTLAQDDNRSTMLVAFEYKDKQLESLRPGSTFYVCDASNHLKPDFSDAKTLDSNVARFRDHDVNASQDDTFFKLEQNAARWITKETRDPLPLDIQVCYSSRDQSISALFGFQHKSLVNTSLPPALETHRKITLDTHTTIEKAQFTLLSRLPLTQDFNIKPFLIHLDTPTRKESLSKKISRLKRTKKEIKKEDTLADPVIRPFIKFYGGLESYLDGSEFPQTDWKNFERDFNSIKEIAVQQEEEDKRQQKRKQFDDALQQIKETWETLKSARQKLVQSRESLVQSTNSEAMQMDLKDFNIRVKTVDRGKVSEINFDNFRGTFDFH